MRIAPKINEITGRRDGIFYTFGNTDVSLILAEKLLALPDNQRKFHAVCSKLSDYTNGLRTLASLPKKAPMRGMMCLDWRNKYFELFEKMLTKEEGQTFLLNLAATRYKEIIIRGIKNDAK